MVMAFTSAAPSFSGAPATAGALVGRDARLNEVRSVEFPPVQNIIKGNRSPNEIERREKRLASAAWLHHRAGITSGYWIDYAADGSSMCGMKMPIQYVIEMFCDRVAASKDLSRCCRDSDPAYDYYAHSVVAISSIGYRRRAGILLRILRDEGERKGVCGCEKLLKTGY